MVTDTGSYTDPALGSEVAFSLWFVGCVGTDWLIQATADGAGDAAIANLWETDTVGGISEEHPLVTPGTGPAFLEALLGGATPTWVPGVSTRFVCGDHDAYGSLTFMLRIYTDDALADCIVWGHDPHGVKEGRHPGDHPISAPEEMASCRVVR